VQQQSPPPPLHEVGFSFYFWKTKSLKCRLQSAAYNVNKKYIVLQCLDHGRYKYSLTLSAFL